MQLDDAYGLDPSNVAWLERELLNGGFAQYFWNPFSHFFADALRGLKALDLGAYLDLLERAGACFPGGRPSLTRRERMVFLEALAREMVREGRASADDETLTILNEGPFDQLNVRFYETYADGTEFYRAIAAYARGHPNEFWK